MSLRHQLRVLSRFPRYLSLLLLLTWAPSAVFAQVAYTLVFGPENSTASGIDSAGRVVGQAGGLGFVWDGAQVRGIGTLGGPSSTALGLSDNGFVTGSADRADGSSHAYLYRDGVLRDIGQLGSASYGAGVNAAGQVAGTWQDADGENHAFLYSGGLARDIGNLGANSARATGINSAGTVVGSSFLADFSAYRAFLFEGGAMRDLGTLGGPSSAAAAINDAGMIAGTSFIDDDVQHAFLYRDGVLRDLGSFGGALTEARALNEAGMVVGYSTYAGDIPGIDFSSAFLYRDGAMFDLNSIVARPGLWNVLDAVGINDAGQIAAYACTDLGDCRAVRLDPITAIPEPSTYALWVTGLGALLLTSRRSRPGHSAKKTRETVASGRSGVREAQLYAEYSEHRRTPIRRAVGLSSFPHRSMSM